MGTCWSAVTAAQRHVLDGDMVLGDGEDYRRRYVEDHVLGEGEFAQVKLVYDATAAADGGGDRVQEPLACKVLKKGVHVKDNVLYRPIKSEVLWGEVNALAKLAGENYCLKLIGAYESPRYIYVVTEYCAGGEMMEYVASRRGDDLRTEDVSRIAYQLLSAVHHCAKHRILHRDVKPENGALLFFFLFLPPARVSCRSRVRLLCWCQTD